jgi:hypothetical protein
MAKKTGGRMSSKMVTFKVYSRPTKSLLKNATILEIQQHRKRILKQLKYSIKQRHYHHYSIEGEGSNNIRAYDSDGAKHDKYNDNGQQRSRNLDNTPSMRTVPLYGNFAEIGYYYIYISFAGDDNKFSVILDTGSGLTVIPCDDCNNCGKHMGHIFKRTSTSKSLQCNTKECSQMSGRCSSGSKCGFTISYSEGSSLKGNFVNDVVCLGERATCKAGDLVPFNFGCANVMTNLFRTQLADGIMGVNNNVHTTLIDALRSHHNLKTDLFSICLGQEGGEFVVGGYNEALSFHKGGDPLWVPQLSPNNPFYKIAFKGISIGGESGSLNLVATLDSGTTYSFIPSSVFNMIREQINAYCGSGYASGDKCLGKKNNQADPDAINCYTVSDAHGGNLTKVMHTFPAIVLHLDNDVKLNVLPYQYFYKTAGNSLCIGMYKDSEFILGMNFFQYQNIIFDKPNKRIGFIPARCSEKDPFCAGGNCSHSTSSWGLDANIILIMIFLSAILSGCIWYIFKSNSVQFKCSNCCRKGGDKYVTLNENDEVDLDITNNRDIELTASTTVENGTVSNEEVTDI